MFLLRLNDVTLQVSQVRILVVIQNIEMANLVRQEGSIALFVPAENTPEAPVIEGSTVYFIDSLRQLISQPISHEKSSLYQADFSLGRDNSVLS